MAITQIYGFQNFRDYTNISFTDAEPFGKLPFHINNLYTGTIASLWFFDIFENRVWMAGKWGSYGSTNSNGARQYTNNARTPSLNFPTTSVYDGYLDDPETNIFTMGVRFCLPMTGVRRPYYLVRLSTTGGNTVNNGMSLLGRDEVPNVADVVFYFEFQIDFNLGVVKRWLDSVRLSDLTLNSTYGDRSLFKDMFFHLGHKYSSSNTTQAYWNLFLFNDLYFIADTSHLDDGLPSGRLGPIEVEPLIPKEVILHATWDNETSKEPAAFLKETVDKINMRGEPGLISDEAGERATVEFEEPEFREGEILYCELEVYGYRNFGDNVGLNTQVKQAEGVADPKHHEVEPERLRVGARTIFPCKFHKPLDGENWTEEKLGQLKLEMWSTKPE